MSEEEIAVLHRRCIELNGEWEATEYAQATNRYWKALIARLELEEKLKKAQEKEARLAELMHASLKRYPDYGAVRDRRERAHDALAAALKETEAKS